MATGEIHYRKASQMSTTGQADIRRSSTVSNSVNEGTTPGVVVEAGQKITYHTTPLSSMLYNTTSVAPSHNIVSAMGPNTSAIASTMATSTVATSSYKSTSGAVSTAISGAPTVSTTVGGTTIGGSGVGGSSSVGGLTTSFGGGLALGGGPSSTNIVSSGTAGVLGGYAQSLSNVPAVTSMIGGSVLVGGGGAAALAAGGPGSSNVPSSSMYTGGQQALAGSYKETTTTATTSTGGGYSGQGVLGGLGNTSSSIMVEESGQGGRETTRVINTYLDYANQKVTETVIRRETGEARVVSVTERVDESRIRVISEKIVEHEVRVPKKRVREEIIEKTMVVNDKVLVEEIVNGQYTVKEKIIEYAHPVIIEKVIEVPEIEYVEKIVEVPEKVLQERVKNVDKVVYQDRVREVAKVVTQERVVEIPDIQYRDVPHEVVVEVPEYRDEYVTKQVPVPQYVDKPVANVVESEQINDVERTLPIAVEAETTVNLNVAELKGRYSKVTYPVYLPRFIEVPVALELMTQQLQVQSEDFIAQINGLTKTAASLCDVENLASNIMKADHQQAASEMNFAKYQQVILESWNASSQQQTTSTTAYHHPQAVSYNPATQLVAATAH